MADLEKTQNGEDVNTLPVIAKGVTIDEIALMEPTRAVQVVKSRIEALETIRKAAIAATNPEDWVAFKDREGNVNYLLAASGAVKIRKYYGISTYRLRPEQPEISTDNDGRRIASICGDAFCNLTGEVALNVVGSRAADEHFVGRGTDEDLKQSARTNLETKAVRILAGMKKVPTSELKECGINLDKTAKGSGYGTGAERKAGKVIDDETKALRKKLGDNLIKYAAGDEEKASETLKQITANPPKFAGFTKLSAMTLKWQVKQAAEKLEILMTEGGAD